MPFSLLAYCRSPSSERLTNWEPGAKSQSNAVPNATAVVQRIKVLDIVDQLNETCGKAQQLGRLARQEIEYEKFDDAYQAVHMMDDCLKRIDSISESLHVNSAKAVQS